MRDAITKDILSYKKFLGRYVIKVEPHRAIMEPDYFIKQIEIAEQNRDEEIERIEAGIEENDDAVDPNLENEWDQLKKLSNDEYLMKTLDPAVVPEMKSSPKRFLMVIIAASLSFFLAVTGILVWSSIRQDETS